MIKKIQIRNVFGIKEFDVDFERKNVISGNFIDIEEQLIEWGKSYYSLVPTFLAKNAAGKTSFIKAIDYVSGFATKTGFMNEISTYITRKVGMIVVQKMTNAMNSKISDTDEIELSFDLSKVADEIITTLFDEISYRGSDESYIYVAFDNDEMSIKLTNHDFEVKINKKSISLSDLIQTIIPKIGIEKAVEKKNFTSVNNAVATEVSKYLSAKKEFKFVKSFNVRTFYQADKKWSNDANVNKKNKVYVFLVEIAKHFGYDSLKLLLQKIDDNIERITEDPEKKTIDIFIKNSQIPINPERLSFGTIKVLELISSSIPLFMEGGVLMVDEVENGLHLSLIKLLVEMYSTPEINIGKAQFFMTTHNPLIIERDIVDAKNVYMNENRRFVNIKDIKGIEKPYDLLASVKSKNYFNDIFWLEKDLPTKSTLSSVTISRIIESFAEGRTFG